MKSEFNTVKTTAQLGETLVSVRVTSGDKST